MLPEVYRPINSVSVKSTRNVMRMVRSHLSSESTQSHKRCLKGNRAGKSVTVGGNHVCGLRDYTVGGTTSCGRFLLRHQFKSWRILKLLSVFEG